MFTIRSSALCVSVFVTTTLPPKFLGLARSSQCGARSIRASPVGLKASLKQKRPSPTVVVCDSEAPVVEFCAAIVEFCDAPVVVGHSTSSVVSGEAFLYESLHEREEL